MKQIAPFFITLILCCMPVLVWAQQAIAPPASAPATTVAPAPVTPMTNPAILQDRTAAVILAYNRIGEDQYPSTNIQMAQFETHLQELQQGGYNIVPLTTILTALSQNSELPPHTVAITFDGGHRSAYESGMTSLLKNNIPFTVFIATDHVDERTDQYIGWEEIKKLQKSSLVTIGLHPASYIRLAARTDEEIRRQLNKARSRLRDETGIESDLFAYPFGEYSLAYKNDVAASGFKFAFGQQSGVASAGMDLMELPRFSMTENFGNLDRFRMAINALPLPVKDIEPKDPRLNTTQPFIGFTVDKSLAALLPRLSCYASAQGKAEVIPASDNRVEIRLSQPVNESRMRLNCTIPGPATESDDTPRWRWFGMMLVNPAVAEQPDEDDDNGENGMTPPDEE